MFRVLIGEPEPLIRAGIKAIINANDDAQVACDLSDIRRLVANERRFDGNAVVLSSAAFRQITIEELHQLVSTWQELRWPVVAVLGSGDTDALADGIKVGIRGFVSQCSAVDDLIESLHATSEEQGYLSAALITPFLNWVSRMIPRRSTGQSFDVSVLSSREEEVLRLLGQGLSNVQIAKRLLIKEATVRSHVYHIMTKLGLQTRAEAIILGLRLAEMPC
jgi:DNA-binding NarL/FixJ family response regulator